MPLEEDVKQDVRKWSEHFLEIPNKHLGGFPACPFAKKTWKDNKVVVEVKRKHKWYKSELNGHLKQLDFSVHEILIFCDPYFNYSLKGARIPGHSKWGHPYCRKQLRVQYDAGTKVLAITRSF
jgi:hypothetical protein